MNSNCLEVERAVDAKESTHDTGTQEGDLANEVVPIRDNEEDEDALFDPSMFDWGLEPSAGTNGAHTRRRNSYSFPVQGSGSSTPRSGDDSVKSRQSSVNESNVKAEGADGPLILPEDLTRIGDDLSNSKTFCSQQSASLQPLSLATSCSTLLHPFAIQSSANCPTLNIAQPFSNDNMASAACFPLTGTNVDQVSDIQHHALAAYFLSQQHLFPLTANTPLYEQSVKKEMPETSVDSSLSQAALANEISANSGSSSMDTSVDPSNLPPFLLFGAPIELRENYMQAQRAHGIRPLHDNNSIHYRMASTCVAASGIRLIDGRHGDVGSKRMRNAREQKRSQKINDLIDQLRDKMEHGGWRVGLKSKFHTLSSCAEFIRHLIKVNKEKESSLRKAKEDFLARKRKRNELKDSRQEPSDPESTASSLTVSSASRHMNRVGQTVDRAKNGKVANKQLSSLDSNDSMENQKETKKARQLDSRESTSSSTSSGVDDEVNTGRKLDDSMLSVAVDQNTGSSLSDITDSNKGLSSGKNCEAISSVTSDAAVARGFDKRPGSQDHSDVVIKMRKRKYVSTECNSLKSQSTFPLDYERIFLKSNIPQILAATSGRIVAYNDFFLKATRLNVAEVERLTIFGLVRSDKLSSMFEVVASVLRSTTKDSDENDVGYELDKNNKDSGCRISRCSTVTMPCTKFRSLPIGENGTLLERQMYLTFKLMSDEEDPQKRCFHCILTDRPSVEGKAGSVTPELLSVLFQKRVKHGTSLSARPNHAPSKKRKKRSIASPEN